MTHGASLRERQGPMGANWADPGASKRRCRGSRQGGLLFLGSSSLAFTSRRVCCGFIRSLSVQRFVGSNYLHAREIIGYDWLGASCCFASEP
jgi:hypothetical protein